MIIAKAKLVIAIAALLAIAPYAEAQQQVAASPQAMGEFDCVVEAKMMTKLGSPDTGLIEALKVDRDTTIKKGEIVAQLDSNLQRIALELAQLKASNEGDINSERTRLAFRSSEAERAENLNSKQIVTTKVRDEAVTERNLAVLALAKAELEHKMAQVDLEQAQARLDRRSIRSPINGVVSDVTIRPGEYVYEQTPLMTIAEIDPLYVKVFVPVRHYRQLHVGTNAEVMPEEPIGGLYKAQVTVVDRVFDTASSTFGVRLELPNPNYALPAGMRCRIRFLAQETGLAPSLLPPVISTASQIDRTSLPNVPHGLSQPTATSSENSPPPETNGGQRPAPENDPPLIASQPLAASSLTTPIAQGQTPKPQSPEVDEALPDADRKPPKAVNSASSVAVPPDAAALPVAISAVGQSPNPPSPENKDVTEVGAQPSPPGNEKPPVTNQPPVASPQTPSVSTRALKPQSSEVKGAQALPDASRRQLRPAHGEPTIARRSAAAPASLSAAGQALSPSSPEIRSGQLQPSVGGRTKPPANGQARARRQNRAGSTTANTGTSHGRGTTASF